MTAVDTAMEMFSTVVNYARLGLHVLPGRLSGSDPGQARRPGRAEPAGAEGQPDQEQQPEGPPPDHATPARRARVRSVRAIST